MNTNTSSFNTLFKLIILLVFLISFSQAFAQTKKDSLEIKDFADIVYDSLKTKLQNETVDTIKVNILNEISWNYAPSNFTKSKQYADSALNYASKIDWQKGEAFALKNIGEALRYNGKVRESLNKHRESLRLFEKLKDDENIASLFCHIGISFYHLSDFQKSFENYNKALKIFSQHENREGIVKVYTYMGILFHDFNDYNKSLDYYMKALEIAEGLEIESTLGSIFGNIGMVYGRLNRFPETLEYYNKAAEIFKKLNDIHRYSIMLGNIGDLYLRQESYENALIYSEKALYYSKKIGDKNGIAFRYANLAKIRYNLATSPNTNKSSREKEALYSTAITNLKESILLFGELGNKVEHLEELLFLSKIYKESGNFEQAFLSLEEAQDIKDSLYTIKVNKAITELEFQQDLELKEKEIAILNKDNEYQNFIKKVLIALAGLFIFASIFMFYLYKNKLKHNRILEENIQIRKEAEAALKKNELELNKHKNQLEYLVRKRTVELENEIVERKRTEEDLLVAIDRVESANKAKSIFLANMSHELRTPLVGILGYSQLLSTEVPTKELKEMTDGIHRTGNRLLNTLSMVLDLARIESDQFEINITEVDIGNELTEIYNNFKGVVSLKNIDFILNISEEAKILNTDQGMFKVIVENLVNNAIKFTKKGKIEIESKIENINNKKYVAVNVIDTGIGIKASEINIIFNEFKQLSEGTLKDFQGTGLGLSISKKFSEHLDGELTVDSKIGEGSTFTLKFPLT